MRDFISCFGESGVQVADASCSSVSVTKSSQNSVICIYKSKLFGKSCLVTIVWSKGLMGHCLSVEIDDEFSHSLSKIDVKPSLFSKRKGSKCLVLNSCEVEVFWDLSMAKFGSGVEPLGLYYVVIVCKGEMVLLIGDLIEEAFKKTGAIASLSKTMLVSKREHVYGKRVFSTKTRFCDEGRIHDLRIECDTKFSDDPSLVVRVDAKPVMLVRNLRWKFRGNWTVVIDGLPVEVFWDVHNWLFGPSLGNAVFMFRAGLSRDKPCDSDPSSFSWSCSESFKEPGRLGLGFSLVLYAWKNE